MKIPHSQLSDIALAAIVLEFVTRDGTDHSSVEKRIASVMRQFENSQVELHFDPETKSCQVVRVAT